jgi:hypothetical protein
MDVITLLSETEMHQYFTTHGRASRPRPPYTIIFPASLVAQGARHLQQNGQHGLEQLALWAGYPTSQGVVIASLLLPNTEATWGWVHILPAEQPQIAEWLHARAQLLFAESHTHGDGRWATEMSDEDRRHPAGRAEGFLTIIIPGYARAGIDFPRAGVWECRSLIWAKLTHTDVRTRLRVVEDQEARDVLA